MTLDELVAFDREVQEIRAAIARTTEETQQRVDWTQLWGERYPVLTTYQQVVDVEGYAAPLKGLLARLEERGDLGRLHTPIYIGQEFRGQELDGLGIGTCCRGCSQCVKGCPPSAEDILQALQ